MNKEANEMTPPPTHPHTSYDINSECVYNNLSFMTDNVASISVFKTSAVLCLGTSLDEEVLAIGSDLAV